MIAIRSAGPSDARALAELRWEFRIGRDAPTEQHDAFITRCAAWIDRELGDAGSWRSWIAEDCGQIVGQIWLRPIDKVPNPVGDRERHAYISNFYVAPSSRGGIGTRLLRTALEWASANGVDRVVLWPTVRSRTLYLRHGFTPNGDVLQLTCQ
jgi:GNAT superfamily N-acetyltransferase